MTKRVLFISASVNLVLAAVLLGHRWRAAHAYPESKPPEPPPAASGPRWDRAQLNPAAAERVKDAWTKLPTEDWRGLVARMRAEGFPPAVMRSIMKALLDEHFAARRQQWERPFPAHVPLVQTAMDHLADEASMRERRRITREQNALMRDLLGADADDEATQANRARRFGPLPPEKAGQVQEIVAEYEELRSQIYTEARGMLLPEDREQLRLLEKAKMSSLAGVLTAGELMEFELRNSDTAKSLRGQLAPFKPSEEEFRLVFSVQRAQGEPGENLPAENSAANRQRLLDGLQGVLPPHRIQELGRAMDPANAGLLRLADRFEWAPDIVSRVISLRQATSRERAAIRADQSLTPEQRRDKFDALTERANAQARAVLGPGGLEAYKRHGGGNWLVPPNVGRRP